MCAASSGTIPPGGTGSPTPHGCRRARMMGPLSRSWRCRWMLHLRHGSRSRACSPFIGAGLLLALVLASAPAGAMTDDQNLTGLAYLSDGTPLSATVWADGTDFAVWVAHSGSWSS